MLEFFSDDEFAVTAPTEFFLFEVAALKLGGLQLQFQAAA